MFQTLDSLSLSDDAGQIDISALELGRSGLKIVRLQSTGHHVDLTEDAQATFLLPQRGRLSTQFDQTNWQAGQGKGLLLGPTSRSTRVVGPFDAWALVLPHHAVLQDLAGSVRLPDALSFRADAPGLRRVGHLMADIHKLAVDGGRGLPPDQAARGLAALARDAVMDLILARVEDQGSRQQPRSQLQRVLWAEELMRARASEPLSMADVARAQGISLRSLQLAFQQIRHMGPRDALNRIRLDMARSALLRAQPGDTVTSIAMDCGVSHVSRFAASYRLAYGEYPAETLTESLRCAS